jgi:hypothetical protein
MNLPITELPAPLNFHLLLEEKPDGQILGRVAELPDCQVIASSQAATIAELEAKLRDRLTKITAVPFSLSPNEPLTDREQAQQPDGNRDREAALADFYQRIQIEHPALELIDGIVVAKPVEQPASPEDLMDAVQAMREERMVHLMQW